MVTFTNTHFGLLPSARTHSTCVCGGRPHTSLRVPRPACASAHTHQVLNILQLNGVVPVQDLNFRHGLRPDEEWSLKRP